MISQARHKLAELESATPAHASQTSSGARPMPVITQPHPVVDELASVRPDEMSPRQALDLLYRLKQLL
ncbi:DNA mismatch repair protein MutS [compost metagenome]